MQIYSTPCSKRPMPILNGSALKTIAVISMISDHCAYYLMEEDTLLYETMRCFGRIAFPVFAFLVAEGFRHTRNRMSYFLHLVGFAVVSEVPWYLLNGADGTHNVMFTLALGVVALAVFERFREHRVICCFTILLIMWLAAWLGVDYEWRGIFNDCRILPFGRFRQAFLSLMQNTPTAFRFSANDALWHSRGFTGLPCPVFV